MPNLQAASYLALSGLLAICAALGTLNIFNDGEPGTVLLLFVTAIGCVGVFMLYLALRAALGLSPPQILKPKQQRHRRRS